MKKYLLDTSICVFLFRDNHDVAQRLNKIGRERCFICDVVLAELRYGAYKSNRTEENLKLIDDFVKEIKVLPFADSIDVYAQEKLRLKDSGKPSYVRYQSLAIKGEVNTHHGHQNSRSVSMSKLLLLNLCSIIQ